MRTLDKVLEELPGRIGVWSGEVLEVVEPQPDFPCVDDLEEETKLRGERRSLVKDSVQLTDTELLEEFAGRPECLLDPEPRPALNPKRAEKIRSLFGEVGERVVDERAPTTPLGCTNP